MRINRNSLLGTGAAVWVAIFAASGVAAPAAADEVVRIRRTCKLIDKQIAHYEGVSEMAKDRRDWMWYDSTRAHVKRLTDRRVKICPEQVAEEKREYFRRGAEAAKELVRIASAAAIKYFSAGWL